MSDARDSIGPSPADIGFDAFLRQFRNIENAWSLLDAAARLEATDALGAVTRAIALGACSSVILVRAAGILDELDLTVEVRNTLEKALALDGPTAPAQIAYARQRHAAGDLPAARRWYRSGLLRARPDMTLMLDYARLEQESGAAGRATLIAAAARSLPPGGGPALISAGRQLLAADRADLAGMALAEAYRRGQRGDDLLQLIAHTDDGSAGPLSDPIDATIAGGPTIRMAAAALRAHGKLASSAHYSSRIVLTREREQSPVWVPFDRLSVLLRDRITRRAPFSWVRLGDGEARFLLHVRPELHSDLDRDEVTSVVALIWSIWFGEPFERADCRRVAELGKALVAAIDHADLLGVTSSERMTDDRQHAGYCSVLEQYLQTRPPDGARLFTDATFNIRLHEADPFLGRLLSGLDFLGVISPHPDLGPRLRRHFGIARGVSYDIPGEGRLGRDRERANRGEHFPSVYDRLMTDLAVPFPGAVFLVAGGLLGKIYCDRIRALGGIALDIGALADAWMGINSRGAPLDQAMRTVLPSG